MNKRHPILIFAFFIFLAVGFCRAGQAQQCLKFHSNQEKTTIYLSSQITVSGVTPATFCKLDTDRKYRLTLTKPGFETRKTMFLQTSAGELKFMSRRPKHFMYSLLMPGWGQAAGEEYSRAFQTFTGAGTAALLWYLAYRSYEDEKDRYNYFSAMFDNSVASSRRSKYYNFMRLSSRLVNVQRDFSLEVAALGGWVYLGSLVETLSLSAPPSLVYVQGANVGLDLPVRTRSKAIFRSFFFPGLGQKYLGKKYKGFIYYSSFITGAYLTLRARRNYEIANVGYEMAVIKLNEAQTLSDVRRAREEIDLTYEN